MTKNNEDRLQEPGTLKQDVSLAGGGMDSTYQDRCTNVSCKNCYY